ncbi:hypothetical protein [Paenibacillus polymyxa]|uniref:Uncharacterized protein n=1 Tax=Paenibacillus polymyxa TaxID=1406 RepID=A0AAP3ZZI8_PAEPO|nr:hypothetical protein [Paenibacillus polymyxa]MDH2332455.1 hypothetical protein [Paenibacillus polymyxa]
MLRKKSHKNNAYNNEYTISKRYPHVYYEGSFAPYEDPADYIRVPTLKGVRIA